MNFADNCSINIDNAMNLIKPNVNVFPLLLELFGITNIKREKGRMRERERGEEERERERERERE